MECKCDKKLWAAVILGVSLIASAFVVKLASSSFIDKYVAKDANKDRKVTVKGLSERKVEANVITWSFTITATGNDLPDLYQEMQKRENKVYAFLTQNGLTGEDIKKLPPDVDDRLNNRWSNENLPYYYKLTTRFTVTTSKIDQVHELINKQGDLISKGISLDGYFNYKYTDFQSLKPEMLNEAFGHARETAEQIAGCIGSSLGKVITADQGQFSIYSSDDNPRLMEVRDVVTITYALED